MIHLIVGNTGAGKTTYSARLKQKTKGVVFSIDQWNNTLFLEDKSATDGLEWMLERIDRSERIILNLIQQLESVNIDSILDLGLSKKVHREKFKNFAKANGYSFKIHFLDISKETRIKHVLSRNEEKGDTFQFEVTKENFEFMENWFERPDQTEMMDGILIKEE